MDIHVAVQQKVKHVSGVSTVRKRPLSEIIREIQEAYKTFITQNIALNDENDWC